MTSMDVRRGQPRNVRGVGEQCRANRSDIRRDNIPGSWRHRRYGIASTPGAFVRPALRSET